MAPCKKCFKKHGSPPNSSSSPVNNDNSLNVFDISGGVGGRSYKYNGEGGFGGGGGAYGNGGGAGGGGGYSGGASGDNFVNSCGGGGGSYNGAFQNIVRIAGYRGFHGYVTINRIY